MKVTQTLIEKFQPAITSAYLALTDSTITLQQLIEEVFSTCETEKQVLEYLEKTHQVSQDVLKDISIRRYVSDVPELLAEYMEEKSRIKATELPLATRRKVWWKCIKKGHIFEEKVFNRSQRSRIFCPVCSFNSLLVQYPKLATELLEEKSGVEVSKLASGSGKNVWWKCSAKEHVFQRIVQKRVKHPECPKCSVLSEKRPDLVVEFLEKKSGFKASDIVWKSTKKAWWKCSAKGHIFEERVVSRSRYSHTNCPVCESLFGKYPDIAKELMEEKSGVKARKIFPCSNKNVWWQCAKGHEFSATVSNRTQKGSICPFCSGRSVVVEKSLAVLRPDLAGELLEKESDVQASKLSLGSGKKVFWKCSAKGHVFSRSVRNYVKNSQCLACLSLAVLRPDLAGEFLEKESGFKAVEVTCGSEKSAFWKCSAKGHVFEKGVVRRVNSPKCPICKKEKSLKSSTK